MAAARGDVVHDAAWRMGSVQRPSGVGRHASTVDVLARAWSCGRYAAAGADVDCLSVHRERRVEVLRCGRG